MRPVRNKPNVTAGFKLPPLKELVKCTPMKTAKPKAKLICNK